VVSGGEQQIGTPPGDEIVSESERRLGICLVCRQQKVDVVTPNHVPGVSHVFCLVEWVGNVVNHSQICVWFEGCTMAKMIWSPLCYDGENTLYYDILIE
jgi:hypothetical protein